MLTFFYNGILSPREPFSHTRPYIFIIFIPNTIKRVRTDFMPGIKSLLLCFLA